jgi:hypothetical protein
MKGFLFDENLPAKEPEQGIVILDAKEYSSLVETLYLLSNPTNRDRLRQDVLQHQQGLVREGAIAVTLAPEIII